MPFNEYKDYSRELNSPIDEWKKIDALPNRNLREMAQLPPETTQIPERSKGLDPEPEINSIDSSAENLSDTRESDRFNENDPKADSGKRTGQGQSDNNNRINNTINNDNTTINSGLETAEAAETSVVSSSAVLTGGVTVVTACAAVAVIGVAATIMNNAPKIVSEHIVTGADYLVYEIDVRDLDYSNDTENNKTQYKIRVHNDTFVMDFPIEEEGMQTQIVTGLIPFRRYTVSVVGTSMIGDVFYNNVNVYTSKLKKPQAAFTFTPKINYKDGLYDIEYKSYISDYYDTGSDTYLQVYVNDTLVVDDHDLPEDGFFKGVLTNMANGTKISAKAYTTYYGEEDTLIGEYGYTVVHPQDFISKQFLSPYVFNEDSITSSFNANELTYNLDINTEFDNSDNPTEKYRIDLYNYGELVKSETTTSENLQFTLDSKYTYVDVVLTEIMGDYEVSSKTVTYVMEPKLFNTEFRFNEDATSYYFEASHVENSTLQGNSGGSGGKINFISADLPELTYKITNYYSDGSEPTSISDSFEYSIEHEAGMDTGVGKEISKVTFEVFLEDKVISYYQFDKPNYEGNLEVYDVDDDGKVMLKYETGADDVFVDYVWLSGNGVSASSAPGADGIMKLDRIDNNYLSECYLIIEGKYKSGTDTEIHVPVNDLALNAKIVSSSFATFELSQLYGAIQLDTYIDINGEEKLCDINLGLELYKETSEYNPDTDEYETVLKYVTMADDSSNYEHCLGMYYKIPTIEDIVDGDTVKYYKYKITAEGFDETGVEYDGYLFANFSELAADRGSSLYEYSLDAQPNKFEDYATHISYVKTTNDDGTVNYYFYTNFSDDASTHYQRIAYMYNVGKNMEYQNPGTNIMHYTDYFNGKYYALENVEDRDYTFTLQILQEINNVKYHFEDVKCREYSSDNVLDLSQSSIYVEENSGGKVISLTFDRTALDTDTLKINYDGKTYNIPFKEEGNDTQPYPEQASRKGYTYLIETADYQMQCVVYDNGYMSVMLFLPDDMEEPDTSNLPTFEAKVYPNIVGKIGTSIVKNYEQLDQGIVEYRPFEYTASSFDDEFVYISVNAYDDGITISASYDNAKVADNRDSMKVIVTDENGNSLFTGIASYGSIYISNLSPSSEKIKVKFIPIKEINNGRTTLVYEDLAFEKEYKVVDLYADTNIPLTISTGIVEPLPEGAAISGYEYTGRILDDTEYYENGNYSYSAKIYEYIVGEEEPTEPVAEVTPTDNSFYYQSETVVDNIEKVKVVIIKTIYGQDIVWQVYYPEIQEQQ